MHTSIEANMNYNVYACTCIYIFLYYNENVSKWKNLILKLTGDDSSEEITPEDRLQHNLSSTANRQNVQ